MVLAARTPEVAAASEDMDQPLRLAAIRSGVAEAKRLASTRNEAAMAEAAGNCQSDLQARPSLAQLDRCAAFDDAVVQLQNRDPMWDAGPFSQVAVTGRQWSGAAGLSNDYLAIDSRLEKISTSARSVSESWRSACNSTTTSRPLPVRE